MNGMESSLLLEILKGGGIMGAVWVATIVPLAVYARAQAQELKAVQERRAIDAQQTVDKLLALNDKWNATVAEQIRTVEAIDTTMTDVKSALNDIRDLLMNRRS